jgi:hypothetical protein
LLSFDKDVMNRDKRDTTTHPFEALANFRGIFKRIALQLDVDPSYVSRVARGQRHAPHVSEALRKEIQRVLGKAGLHDGNGHSDGHALNGSANGTRQASDGSRAPKHSKRKKAIERKPASSAQARKS